MFVFPELYFVSADLCLLADGGWHVVTVWGINPIVWFEIIMIWYSYKYFMIDTDTEQDSQRKYDLTVSAIFHIP